MHAENFAGETGEIIAEFTDDASDYQPSQPEYVTPTAEADAGTRRLRDPLQEIKAKSPKTLGTPERIAVKKFAQDVQKRVESHWQLGVLRFKPPWTDPTFDMIMACFGENACGHISCKIYAHSQVQECAEECRVATEVSFDATTSARIAARQVLAGMNASSLAALIGMPAESLTINVDKASLGVSFLSDGQRDQLLNQIATVFMRFLCIFRPLIESPPEQQVKVG
jgi:hypothetical protein